MNFMDNKTQNRQADGFAAALAFQERGAVLVTGDKEFKSLEGEVKMLWLKGE